jgi:signal transduction histidine kinase
MSSSYSFSSDLWPALITVILIIFLGSYSWHRRNIPGAKPFVIGCIFGALWALGALLEISGNDFTTKVFWIKFQLIWQVPTVTALMCFVLIYAGLSRWLTRRNLILLAIPPIIFLSLIITNDYHHLVWIEFQTANYTAPIPGIGNRIFLGYSYVLGLINIIVLIWLAIRSPQHRWPVILLLFSQVISRTVYLLNYVNARFWGPDASILFVLGLTSVIYAVALFRFRVFDPIPLARSAVIEQMREGMIVMDLQRRIVDLNSAAAKILGNSTDHLCGKAVTEIMPVNLSLPGDNSHPTPIEITIGGENAIGYYSLNITSLVDKRGQLLGYLLLLHDITEQKQAQAQILQQQQVVATLKERERLARELHDSIGQVLGYVNLQAQTIRQWVQAGNSEKAESLLIRLADVAKGAHTDIRESILNLKAGSSQSWAFLPTLRQYLNDFQTFYSIPTELSILDGLREDTFEPAAEVQLLRVIQEALSNARKHAGARTIRVTLNMVNNRGYITISDDGSGFDPQKINLESGKHFGLVFMKERMSQIGGTLDIESQPCAGTVIKLEVPTRLTGGLV